MRELPLPLFQGISIFLRWVYSHIQDLKPSNMIYQSTLTPLLRVKHIHNSTALLMALREPSLLILQQHDLSLVTFQRANIKVSANSQLEVLGQSRFSQNQYGWKRSLRS